jgi:hypothetical protein
MQLHKVTAIRASFLHSFIHVVNINTHIQHVYIYMYILKMYQIISNSLSKVYSG